jgi:hypothetical protein
VLFASVHFGHCESKDSVRLMAGLARVLQVDRFQIVIADINVARVENMKKAYRRSVLRRLRLLRRVRRVHRSAALDKGIVLPEVRDEAPVRTLTTAMKPGGSPWPSKSLSDCLLVRSNTLARVCWCILNSGTILAVFVGARLGKENHSCLHETTRLRVRCS